MQAFNMNTKELTNIKKKIRTIFNGAINVDSFSFKDNVLTIRRGFFYTHGGTAEKFAASKVPALIAAVPEAEFKVIDSGEQWKPFRGGDSVAKGSHWWVKIKITPKVTV